MILWSNLTAFSYSPKNYELCWTSGNFPSNVGSETVPLCFLDLTNNNNTKVPTKQKKGNISNHHLTGRVTKMTQVNQTIARKIPATNKILVHTGSLIQPVCFLNKHWQPILRIWSLPVLVCKTV